MMEDGKMTPFRMQILMDVAARVVKIMVTGAWHLSFEEMDLVLDYVRCGIETSRKKNEEEDGNVFKDRKTEGQDEISPGVPFGKEYVV